MSTTEALLFLATEGIHPLGPGRWREVSRHRNADLSSNDVAQEMVSVLLRDEETAPAIRLRTAFGLLDVLDDWWVTVELGWFLAEQNDPAITAAFWAGYRERLEREEPVEPVHYSLWVEWFEKRDTAAMAFAQVLGDDVHRLAEPGPMRRRAARVLENSGPVPWTDKHSVYLAAKAVPELHFALFRAVLLSYHDVYGSLDPAAGLALLDGLNLPPDTEDLVTLTAVLRAGGVNRYRTPQLWPQLRGDG